MVLLMFSGGIDSSALLEVLLKKREEFYFDIHVHHVEIKNKAHRWTFENKACEKNISYLKNKYGEFEYTSSSVDLMFANVHYKVDSEIYMFMAGQVCKNLSNVTEVFVGWNFEDFSFEKYEGTHDKYSLHRSILLSSFYNSLAGVKVLPTVQVPFQFVEKKDIIKNMDPFLLENSFYCRQPSKEGKPCNECISCNLINESLEAILLQNFFE
jgi:7-cyano-7-deazaguanine synthase in queuosine biosynthesis